MGKFSHQAFITRRTPGSALLVFSEIEESVLKQHDLITRTGEKIHELLQVEYIHWWICHSLWDFIYILLYMCTVYVNLYLCMCAYNFKYIYCLFGFFFYTFYCVHCAPGEPVSTWCHRHRIPGVAGLHRLCRSDDSDGLLLGSTLLPAVPCGQHWCSPADNATFWSPAHSQ